MTSPSWGRLRRGPGPWAACCTRQGSKGFSRIARLSMRRRSPTLVFGQPSSRSGTTPTTIRRWLPRRLPMTSTATRDSGKPCPMSSRSWTRTCPGSWAGRSGSIRAFVTAKLDTTWRRADHMLVPPAGPSTVHLTRAPSRPRDALSCRDLMGGFGGFGGSPIPQPTRVRARMAPGVEHPGLPPNPPDRSTMNQLSLYGDDDDNRGNYAGNSKDCSLLSSISEVRELAREYFPLPPEKPPRLRRRRPATRKQRVQAARRGLVAKWSAEFGFISLHDPGSGAWHDVPTMEAPGWAKWEVRKRKQLYRAD